MFRKYVKIHDLKLQVISTESPKIHQLTLGNRTIKTVSLISPSNAANRFIGANPLYKKLKKIDNTFTTTHFRIAQYKKHFL